MTRPRRAQHMKETNVTLGKTLFDNLNDMRRSVGHLRTHNNEEHLALVEGRLQMRASVFDRCPFRGRRRLCTAAEAVDRANCEGRHRPIRSLHGDLLAAVRSTFPSAMTAEDLDLLLEIQQALANPAEVLELLRCAARHRHFQVASAAANA